MNPEYGRVHRDGHDTEHAAAREIRAHAPTVAAKVLALLAEAGYDGLTDDEGAARLGGNQDRLNFGRRRNELVILGKVRDSGQRRVTPSGRKAIVWMLADLGVTQDELFEQASA